MTGVAVTGSGSTVGAVLRAAGAQLARAGIATARQDAEALLARATGSTRLGLYTNDRAPMPPGARAAVEALLARRARHEPLQYLLGETEFAGVTLAVGPGVFIPRPETELVVERALALGPPGPATVLELCTGSGAIACALAARRPDWTVWAVEREAAVAACARANTRRLGLDARIRIREGDLFAPLGAAGLEGAADLVVANPPYLATPVLPTLPAEVRDWEPPAALDGGADGLDVIRRLVAAAPDWLCPGGALVLEIGEAQGAAVQALVETDGRYGAVAVRRDFRECERVLDARRR